MHPGLFPAERVKYAFPASSEHAKEDIFLLLIQTRQRIAQVTSVRSWRAARQGSHGTQGTNMWSHGLMAVSMLAQAFCVDDAL
jgi:hypothetical protein